MAFCGYHNWCISLNMKVNWKNGFMFNVNWRKWFGYRCFAKLNRLCRISCARWIKKQNSKQCCIVCVHWYTEFLYFKYLYIYRNYIAKHKMCCLSKPLIIFWWYFKHRFIFSLYIAWQNNQEPYLALDIYILIYHFNLWIHDNLINREWLS